MTPILNAILRNWAYVGIGNTYVMLHGPMPETTVVCLDAAEAKRLRDLYGKPARYISMDGAAEKLLGCNGAVLVDHAALTEIIEEAINKAIEQTCEVCAKTAETIPRDEYGEKTAAAIRGKGISREKSQG